MCGHLPPCPTADAPDRDAACVVAAHPEQGWSLLCNGVVCFEDLGELLPDGSYFHLFAPAEEFRASYLRDPARRRLLAAGTAESLDFTSARITAVRVESGARLVMVLRVSKRPDREINYGSGRAVSGESIAAAHTPVKLSLLRGSYLNLPITEEPSATSRPAPGH